MPPPHAGRGVRSGQAPTAAPSSQRSAYPRQTPPTNEDTQAVSSQYLGTGVDGHAFLLSSDPVTSGCDLMVGSPSCSSPLPTHNDGTGRGPVHPKRPTIENQSSRCLRPRGPLRASVRQTTSCSSLEGRLTCGLYRKPRREGIRPSWARFPSWAGTSSRAAREGYLKSGPLLERLDQAGRRPAIIDAIPALDGIIFRSDLGWVLMTAGYPPP
jgi:hypothetical protein